MNDARVLLGSWTCPSGNSVDDFYRPDPDEPALGDLDCQWDEPPPFRDPADPLYHLAVIEPGINRRVQEYTEHLGHGLWILSE